MHLFVCFLAVCTFGSSIAVNIKIVNDCDPKPLVIEHEGKKPCVYLDKRNDKRVGVGYNMQSATARTDFQTVGADFEKFNNGPVTPAEEICNCSRVPCLADGQINELLGISLKVATSDARRVIKTFSSLCCPVQNVMVDLAFTLGGSGFAQLTTFANLINTQNWQAAADDLTVSTWCVAQETVRCTADSGTVGQGCPCSSPYPQSCPQRRSCCPSSSSATCCNETINFSGYITKTFSETWCCPLTGAVCCLGNSCCQPKNPVCCPGSNVCCSRDYPVCCIEPRGVSYCCSVQYPVCQGGQRCGAATVRGGVRETILGTVGQPKYQKL